MEITAIKYPGQGGFKVKKGTIDKLSFFTENNRHLPIASVNDPLACVIMKAPPPFPVVALAAVHSKAVRLLFVLVCSGFVFGPCISNTFLSVHSGYEIISLGNRKLFCFLYLCSCCCVTVCVLYLFLAVP